MLEKLYQEAILAHYKRPRNRGRLDPHTHHAEGLNPSCGDELELFMNVEDGVVTDIKFVGEGCAISQASASMLTEAVKGKPVADALGLSQKFKAMIRGEAPDPALGELQALQGVAKLHARVKCATLAWVTLEEGLGGKG
jgi:nitrogen fixation protein NifU and related proteins